MVRVRRERKAGTSASQWKPLDYITLKVIVTARKRQRHV